MATSEQMTASIVDLIASVKELRSRLTVTEALLAAKDHGSKDEYGGDKGSIVDRKFFEPKPFNKGDIFREWSDDFLDLVDSRKPDWADLLRTARDTVTPIIDLGHTPEIVENGKSLYRVLKRLILHPEARPLIVHVADRNVWEGFRQLHARFDPRNDAAADAVAQRIMSVAAWRCKTIQDIPVMLARWEGLQREHETRTGETVLTLASQKQILLNMIPPAMKEHIRLQTLLLKRTDLTYEKIRMFVLQYTQEAASDLSMPMDISALEASNAKAANCWANWSDGPEAQREQQQATQLALTNQTAIPPAEPLDSFGYQAKGQGVGKGGGAGGKGDKGKLDKDACAICKRKGHWKSECWYKDEVDPATGKKKGEPKGGKAKGAKGKGENKGGEKYYRRTGANSFEEVPEDEAWGAEEDSGKAEAQNLEESDFHVGLGSAFEDSGYEEFRALAET